jgi:hypothetical protein
MPTQQFQRKIVLELPRRLHRYLLGPKHVHVIQAWRSVSISWFHSIVANKVKTHHEKESGRHGIIIFNSYALGYMCMYKNQRDDRQSRDCHRVQADCVTH